MLALVVSRSIVPVLFEAWRKRLGRLPCCIRRKDDLVSVGSPERAAIKPRIQRQPSQDLASDIPDPNVSLLIRAAEGDTRPIGRDLKALIRA